MPELERPHRRFQMFTLRKAITFIVLLGSGLPFGNRSAWAADPAVIANGSIRTTKGIEFPRFEVGQNQTITAAPGDGFFFIVAGGGSAFAFGYRGVGGPIVILSQTGLFAVAENQSGKINLFHSGDYLAIKNLVTGESSLAVYVALLGATR